MSTRTKVVRVTATTIAAAGLVTATAGTSSAASKQPLVPHSLSVAKAAIPSARSLPGGVVLNGKVLTGLHSSVELCYGKPRDVSFDGAAAAGAFYSHPGAPSAASLNFQVSVSIFKTPAAAASVMATLVKAERSCPKLSTYTGSDSTMRDSRTLSTAGHDGDWTTYRTVDHLVYTDGTGVYHSRDLDTEAVRGNVIIDVEETAPDLAGTGPHQTGIEAAAFATLRTKVAAIKS
jgi:PknH-like extracellular domain